MLLRSSSKFPFLKMGTTPDVRTSARSYDDITTKFEVRQP